MAKYIEIGEPTQWVAVLAHSDGSGIIGLWGPFTTEDEATQCTDLMPEAMGWAGSWTVHPMGRVLTDRTETPNADHHTE